MLNYQRVPQPNIVVGQISHVPCVISPFGSMLSPYFCIPCMKKKTSCSQSKLDFSFQGETTIVDEYRMIISHSQVKVNCHLYRLYLSYPSIKPIKYPYPIKSSFFFAVVDDFSGFHLLYPQISHEKKTQVQETHPPSPYLSSISLVSL